MRVVMVALSSHSYGELHNAICVASQLKSQGVEVLFLTSESLRAYTQSAGMTVRVMPPALKQREILREVVADYHPDALVLADYHLLDMEQNSLDLQVLTELPVACATFDLLGLAPEPRVLVNSLIRPEDERRLGRRYKRLQSIRALPEDIHILRPCPVNSPHQTNGRTFPVKLFEKPFALPEQQKKEVRQRFGLKDRHEKLIMFAKATWGTQILKYRQIAQAGHSAKVTYTYEAFLQDLLTQYLANVEEPVTVVGVLPHIQDGGVTHTQKNIRFVNMPFLEMDAFLELVFSCDLFVSDNLPSSAMAKAVFCGVPALALQNTGFEGTQDGSPLTVPENWNLRGDALELVQKWNRLLPGGIYPFRLYPTGWVDELKPLFDNNPYTDAIVNAEMYDVEGTARNFADLLCNDTVKANLRTRQQAYIEQVLALPSAVDTFATWIPQAAKKGIYA